MKVALFSQGERADPGAIVKQRGYYIPYRDDEVIRCPGCGRQNWHIGRMSAECAFCNTAVPLMTVAAGPGTIWQRGPTAFWQGN